MAELLETLLQESHSVKKSCIQPFFVSFLSYILSVSRRQRTEGAQLTRVGERQEMGEEFSLFSWGKCQHIHRAPCLVLALAHTL